MPGLPRSLPREDSLHKHRGLSVWPLTVRAWVSRADASARGVWRCEPRARPHARPVDALKEEGAVVGSQELAAAQPWQAWEEPRVYETHIEAARAVVGADH